MIKITDPNSADKIIQLERQLGWPEDGNFNPQNFLTRAEAAKIVSKMLDLNQ